MQINLKIVTIYNNDFLYFAGDNQSYHIHTLRPLGVNSPMSAVLSQQQLQQQYIRQQHELNGILLYGELSQLLYLCKKFILRSIQ